MSSGDDIEVGRMAYADNWTRIWAQGSFGDSPVFLVEPSLDNPPAGVFDGIIGVGWSGTNIPVTRATGGSGVIGKGGLSQGTGVLGLAGGASLVENGNGWLAKGTGGVGVHGIGGSNDPPSWDEAAPAGAGVIGEGGTREWNTRRLPLGPGVIGLGGRHWWPTEWEAGGVGVYGQGADAEIRQVNDNDVDMIAGPNAPGYGIVGKGGLFDPPQETVATGVVGLAGGHAVPPVTIAGDAGVFGHGPVGVKGISGDSPDGVGVVGESTAGLGVRGKSESNDGVVGASSASGRSGVRGRNSAREGTSYGVFGTCVSRQGAGVYGTNDSDGDAVLGFSRRGVGVRGNSELNDGVVGCTLLAGHSGVYGENTYNSREGYAVRTTYTSPPNWREIAMKVAKPDTLRQLACGMIGHANDVTGIGVLGLSEHGVGVSSYGGRYGASLQGGGAPLRLLPSGSVGPPSAGQVGELYVDSAGSLFFCKGSGIWAKLA
jgi:hypothetical protein